MISQKRLTTLIEEAAKVCGSQAALARRLGVRPSAVTEWLKGRAGPNWTHLIQMQDIARRAACVLLAWLALAWHQDADAAFNKTPLVPATSPSALIQYTLCEIQAVLAGDEPLQLDEIVGADLRLGFATC